MALSTSSTLLFFQTNLSGPKERRLEKAASQCFCNVLINRHGYRDDECDLRDHVVSLYFEMRGGDAAKVRQVATTFILITRTFIMDLPIRETR